MLLRQLLTDYPAAEGSFDEMRDEAGETRAHWRTFLEYLSRETPHEMRQRIDNVRRRLRNNGVTYNVYDDASGVHRPWDLNVLPLILPHDEWAGIEAAVTQRATLLNRILIDVYGEQKLLQEGFDVFWYGETITILIVERSRSKYRFNQEIAWDEQVSNLNIGISGWGGVYEKAIPSLLNSLKYPRLTPRNKTHAVSAGPPHKAPPARSIWVKYSRRSNSN